MIPRIGTEHTITNRSKVDKSDVERQSLCPEPCESVVEGLDPCSTPGVLTTTAVCTDDEGILGFVGGVESRIIWPRRSLLAEDDHRRLIKNKTQFHVPEGKYDDRGKLQHTVHKLSRMVVTKRRFPLFLGYATTW